MQPLVRVLNRCRPKLGEAMRALEEAPDLDLSVNSEAQNALMLAFLRKKPPVIQALLDRHFPVDKVDSKGQTALHCAFEHAGMSSFILTLIERGADLNAVDSRGRTPLFLACSSLHYEKIANCLIDMGASVQSPARFTCEPLMAAIEHSSERICLKLFRKGAMWSMNSYNITPHLLQKTIRNKRPMLATTILKQIQPMGRYFLYQDQVDTAAVAFAAQEVDLFFELWGAVCNAQTSLSDILMDVMEAVRQDVDLFYSYEEAVNLRNRERMERDLLNNLRMCAVCIKRANVKNLDSPRLQRLEEILIHLGGNRAAQLLPAKADWRRFQLLALLME